MIELKNKFRWYNTNKMSLNETEHITLEAVDELSYYFDTEQQALDALKERIEQEMAYEKRRAEIQPKVYRKYEAHIPYKFSRLVLVRVVEAELTQE